MAFKLNLGKAERRVLPEGWYKARTDVVELRPQDERDDIVHLELLTEGNDNIGDDNPNDTRLYRDQSLGERSLWSVKDMAEAHFGKLEGDDEGDFEFDFGDMEDTQVWVYVSIDDEYDGTPRNRVDDWAHIESELDEDGNPVREETSTRILGEPVEA